MSQPRDYFPLPPQAILSAQFRDGYRAGIQAAANYVDSELDPQTAEYIRIDFQDILQEEI